MTTELDHNNRPVPADETPETAIKVWRVSADPPYRFDWIAVRGWAAMLDLLRDEAERRLDGATDDEAREGVTLTVRLAEMTRGEYDALETD